MSEWRLLHIIINYKIILSKYIYQTIKMKHNRLRSFQVPREPFSRYHVFFSFYRNAKAWPCTSRSEKGVKQAKVDRSRHLSVCEIAINETKSLPIYLTPATLSFLSPPNVPTLRLPTSSPSPLHPHFPCRLHPWGRHITVRCLSEAFVLLADIY